MRTHTEEKYNTRREKKIVFNRKFNANELYCCYYVIVFIDSEVDSVVVVVILKKYLRKPTERGKSSHNELHPYKSGAQKCNGD